MKSAIKLVLFLTLLSLASSCSVKPDAPGIPMTINGASGSLKATEVVPTLDTPIPSGKNAIWCASFLSAWKALEGLAGEPISLEEMPDVAKSLNGAADPRPHIPPELLYVATGWAQQGIIGQIQEDLRRRFPTKASPTFPGITPDSFLSYSYLEATVAFSRPYRQNPKPFVFTDGTGRKTDISSFGIPSEDYDAYHSLRSQARVLFCAGEPRDSHFEFAIDLCANSSPSQVVIARIPLEATLAEALARVDKAVARWNEQLRREPPRHAKRLQSIGPSDALLVPDFHWFISHRFSQIEGKRLKSPKLAGHPLDVAQQDILFRLDKSGAELKSEAKAYTAGVGTDYCCDRPFLIYMKKRDAQMPYFAMWVDNAELLRSWQGVDSRTSSGPAARRRLGKD
jgi:hypothetical protein